MTAWRLGLLAAATFLYVTFETFPVGLLAQIATDLRVTQGQVGLLVSGYAVAAGIATIPSVRLVSKWPRKRAVILSLAVLMAAEVLTVTAAGYPALVASRLLAAVTHGILWSLVAPAAAALVSPSKTGMATAVVFGGATGAVVMGVPACAWLGGAFGWRIAALAVAVATALVTVGIAVAMPGVPAGGVPADRVRADRVPAGHAPGGRVSGGGEPDYRGPGGGGEGRASGIVHLLGMRWRALISMCGLAALVVFAHFVSYTYFALLVGRAVAGRDGLVAFLALYGVAGLAATIVAGRLIDRRPVGTVLGAVGALAIGMGGTGLSGLPIPPAVAVGVLVCAVILWGGAYAVIGPSYQAAVMRAAGEHEDFASSVYVTCYQAGIAAGSAVGARIVAVSTGWLPVVSFAVALLALVVTVRVRRVYAGQGDRPAADGGQCPLVSRWSVWNRPEMNPARLLADWLACGTGADRVTARGMREAGPHG
ncbi:MAG: MFS transporter [Bifidobacteriaceae bacterium]|jgi:predicted MFS family arabinose efflux permease|nr:MFS transporter [Bifidobacteriaceae bacterium]